MLFSRFKVDCILLSMGGGRGLLGHASGGESTIFKSWLPPSTMEVPGIEFRSSDMVSPTEPSLPTP